MRWALTDKLLLVGGIICMLYYLVIILYAGITADFAWLWPVTGILLSGCAFLHAAGILGKAAALMPVPVRAVLITLATVGILLTVFLLQQILRGMFTNPVRTPDYIVVLGAQIRGTEPSRALVRRLNKALEAAEKYPEAVLIVSGGQGPDEIMTEAACMRNYLTARGFAAERLLLEERSTSTWENLLFTKEMVKGITEKEVGIISNNFHIFRACAIAEKQGYEHITGLPASSDPVMQVHFVIREVLALLNEYRRGTAVFRL